MYVYALLPFYFVAQAASVLRNANHTLAQPIDRIAFASLLGEHHFERHRPAQNIHVHMCGLQAL